jgi:4a-hydroxytetrahydrobiopterin dehydratase
MNTPKVLTEKEIEERLREFPGWVYEDNKIKKEFSFDNFTAVTRLACELAPFCDEIDHHPDVKLTYRKAFFELQRFDAGGKVTDRDFVVARKIEDLYKTQLK